MKKEYLIVLVIGFLILSYILDAVVNPLTLDLITPYHFLAVNNFTTYPFTTTSIVLKALAIVLTPMIVLSALGLKKIAHAITLFVLSALLQLYALQDIASGAYVVPLEWSLGFTLAGLLLFIPVLIFFAGGLLDRFTTASEPPTTT